jgi:hypothetical protein
MKLINRQTGNNCYDIIKDYKNGVTARLYQTVAFFFGSSLKQDWDMKEKTDRQIESIVREIDGIWYNNPYKPGLPCLQINCEGYLPPSLVQNFFLIFIIQSKRKATNNEPEGSFRKTINKYETRPSCNRCPPR